MMHRLPEKLKKLRKKKGWSQEDLAHEVGVSLSTIQRWERKGALKPFRLARKELEKLFEEADIDVAKD
jgi:transcriptional regulator with XRE-family HTH domain